MIELATRFALLIPLLLTAPTRAQGPLLQSGEAAIVGCDADCLARAAGLLTETVAAGELLGAVVLVARGNTIVMHEAFGWRDPAHVKPMAKDSLFRMASNTKAVTAAAILALVDDGKVALDDAAAKFLPTFAQGDAAKITIRQLLTHTSGLRIKTLFLSPLMTKSTQHPDAPNLLLEALRFGEVGPAVTPNTTYGYSNPGYNTLAAVVEVASGQSYAKFCKARFYDPLGMRDSNNHETTADLTRMSAVVRAGEPGQWDVRWQPGDPPTVPFVRGSGGMISTAPDFARFCRMLLDGGRCGERTILSAAAVRASTRSQTGHIAKASYGFGWRIEASGAFVHGGSDGTFAWCDPARDLIGILFTQTQGGPKLDQQLLAARKLIDAACPPR